MKKSFFLGFLFFIPASIFAQIFVTFTNQADVDAYSFQAGSDYNVSLLNDTTLPLSGQIANMQSLLTITGYLNLNIEHTLLTSLAGVENSASLFIYMEGNKMWDTLFIPDDVEYLFGLSCERTFLKRIYGAEKVRFLNGVNLIDNDRLKDVHLALPLLDSTSIPLWLKVEQNDSLKTFYWGDMSNHLSTFNFFENRQMKHVHIETVRNKINGKIEFNPDLDSISGFLGLDSIHSMFIKQNYQLAEACVFQRGIENYLVKYPNLTHFFEIQNNATGLKSLNDLLTADCSWLPNGVEEPFLGDLHIYPNPAHTEVFIPIPEKPTVYHIYDMTGKEVSSGLVASDGRISLVNVSKGMYVLLVGNKRNKLLVQ